MNPIRVAMAVFKEIFEYHRPKIYQTHALLPRMDYLELVQWHCQSSHRPQHWFRDRRWSLPIQVCELQHLGRKRHESIPDAHKHSSPSRPSTGWGLQIWHRTEKVEWETGEGQQTDGDTHSRTPQNAQNEGSKKQFTNHEINTPYASLLEASSGRCRPIQAHCAAEAITN